MTLLVRDEADIIRENIEYHLSSGVDFIVAMDNHSVDGTTEILREYERLGKLRYFYEDSFRYLQDVWVTKLAHVALQDHHADWIINNDADEFFISSHGNIKDALNRIPKSTGAVSVKRHDFIPFVRAGALPPPIEMIYRKSQSLEWYKKSPIADKVIHNAYSDMQISRGSHTVKSLFIKQKTPVSDIYTFHYPIRSYPQFENKVKNIGYGWMQISPNRNSRYTYWYQCLQDGTLEDVYFSYQLTRDQVLTGLQSGEIIEDRYLANYIISSPKISQ